MGILRALKSLDSKADGRAGASWPKVPWTGWLDEGTQTQSGISVSPASALNTSAVWTAVNVLSRDVASLPLIVYRRDGSSKQRDTKHPLYEVLHDFANPYMTSFQWRLTMMGHLLTWGNCYSEKVYDRAGRLQLWPIKPERIEAYWDKSGEKAYDYLSPTGQRKTLDPDTVFHVAGLGYDGLIGYSPVRMARATIGIAQAAETFAAGFYRNGARPSVVLTVPAGYPEPAKVNLKNAWDSAHSGAHNAGKTAMLEDGVVPTTLSMPLDDAQFLETRKFEVTEVARWFVLPTYKLNDLERATFSNIEQQAIDYVVGSLRPWLVNWEQTIRLQLMRDEPDHYAEFLVDALLRGDSLARSQALQLQLRNGALTPDEWRAIENRNPLPDGAGESPYFAADLIPAAEPVTEETPTDQLQQDVPPRLTVIKAARAFLTAASQENNRRIDSDIAAHRESERLAMEATRP